MELWIRSQDKMKLCQARLFELDNDQTGIFCFNGEEYSIFAGKYKSKERALEVLNDISSKIKNQFIVEVAGLWKIEDVMKMRDTLKSTYDGEFIMETKPLKIKPINQNLIYYEMPQE